MGELVVKDCKADEFKDCDLIFSGLDSSVAGDIGSSYPSVQTIDDINQEYL